ncbi:hypothetical protein ACFL0U_02090 [Pseudomonadota bacterium]
MQNKHKEITFVELKKLNTKGLVLKLRKNRTNLELITEFGIQQNSTHKTELAKMLIVSFENIDVIMCEITIRLRKNNSILKLSSNTQQ